MFSPKVNIWKLNYQLARILFLFLSFSLYQLIYERINAMEAVPKEWNSFRYLGYCRFFHFSVHSDAHSRMCLQNKCNKQMALISWLICFATPCFVQSNLRCPTACLAWCLPINA